MNILEKQAMKLIKERGFSKKDAVKIAYEQQKERGFIKDGKLTEDAIAYGKLSSFMREKIRDRVKKGDKFENFKFVDGKVYYVKN